MSITQLNTIRNRAKPIFQAHGISKASIFGSAVRGELKKKSDIDFLIDTKGKFSLVDFIDLKHALEKSLARPVDLLEYQAIKPSLRKKISEEQILL
ncbi:MAG: nucleotidyltransferase domain-containing protein [Patescibacteria group bacterium]